MASDKFVKLREAKGRTDFLIIVSGAQNIYSRLYDKHRTWLIESTWLEFFPMSPLVRLFDSRFFLAGLVFFGTDCPTRPPASKK